MHTLLTDYRSMYYEDVELGTHFSTLNTKLTGTDEMLFKKVTDFFTNHLAESMVKTTKDKFTVDLKMVAGKRILKWCFNGSLLGNLDRYVSFQMMRIHKAAKVKKCNICQINTEID